MEILASMVIKSSLRLYLNCAFILLRHFVGKLMKSQPCFTKLFTIRSHFFFSFSEFGQKSFLGNIYDHFFMDI